MRVLLLGGTLALLMLGCGENASRPLQAQDEASYCARLCSARSACDLQAEDVCLKACGREYPLGYPGHEATFDRRKVFAWLSCVETSRCGSEAICREQTFEQMEVLDGVEACQAQATRCPYAVDAEICDAYGFALEEFQRETEACWRTTCPNLDGEFGTCVEDALF